MMSFEQNCTIHNPALLCMLDTRSCFYFSSLENENWMNRERKKPLERRLSLTLPVVKMLDSTIQRVGESWTARKVIAEKSNTVGLHVKIELRDNSA